MDKLFTKNEKTLDVTFVKPTTQVAQRYLRMYEHTKRGSSIFTAYGKPSSSKVVAFNAIEKEMQEVNGNTIKITGAGSGYFSCAYRVKDSNNKEFLIYHTYANKFAIPLE